MKVLSSFLLCICFLQSIYAGKFLTLEKNVLQRNKESSIKFNNFLKTVREVQPRVPIACLETVRASSKSLVKNTLFMVPVFLALDARNMKNNVKPWLKKGLQKGFDAAKVSAVYAGSEAMCRTLRNTEDGINSCVASGLSAAAFKMKEGPYVVARSFAAGYGFMFAINKVMGKTDLSTSKNPIVSPIVSLDSAVTKRVEDALHIPHKKNIAAKGSNTKK